MELINVNNLLYKKYLLYVFFLFTYWVLIIYCNNKAVFCNHVLLRVLKRNASIEPEAERQTVSYS